MSHPSHSNENPRVSLGTLCKQILNSLAEAAQRSVVRSRFASLDLRALDDIGLTIAERDDLLLR